MKLEQIDTRMSAVERYKFWKKQFFLSLALLKSLIITIFIAVDRFETFSVISALFIMFIITYVIYYIVRYKANKADKEFDSSIGLEVTKVTDFKDLKWYFKLIKIFFMSLLVLLIYYMGTTWLKYYRGSL